MRVTLSLSGSPMFLGVKQMPVVLKPVLVSNVLCAPNRLVKELAATYLADTILRSPVLLGSLDLLGNPTQFINSVATGFTNLVTIPASALQNGPSAFVW